jgi:5-formyltetrahydrofolate cyclo-ligase
MTGFNMTALSKIELRRSLLDTRLSLSTDLWCSKSASICQHLQASALFAKAKTVLAYFSFRQEPDLSSLFGLSKRWGFPRCVGNALSWHWWQSEDELEVNRYGIPEPLSSAPEVATEQVDLMLIPGVAGDRLGYRLGYGGGYYDRLLSRSEWQNIPKIGIMFDFAYLTALPTDEWDIPLTGFCTENGLFCPESAELI